MASSSASRLRKYVADEGTSSKVHENFCLIGTPLPALDSKKHDANEYKPLWEQEVRDEQGRRRLHGAFTGGWSAGYFNTAGSKEGWTPATFKSSRKDKEAKDAHGSRGRQQRPEDFMDEEDLEELRAQREVGASEAYAYGEQKGKATAKAAQYDPLLGALGPPPDTTDGAEGSIAPARRTLGLQLLTRMGWRAGTGLGPRVSAARHRALSILAGLAPSGSLEGAEASEAVAKHGLAPPDSKLVQAVGWEGRRGLGSQKRENTKVGGLEDALRRARSEQKAAAPGDDTYGEDAVYAQGDDIHASTLARPREARAAAAPSASAARSHDAGFDASENRWSDGRAVLRGFRIAARALGKEAWFAPPAVPKGWEPSPQRVWAADAQPAGASGAPPPGPPPNRPGTATLKPDDRASILGEARNPGPPPSIMHYLSAKDRERLERAREAASSGGAAGVAAALGAIPPPTALPVTSVVVPPTDARTAQAALSGFTPFASDVAKQERYTYYLRSQASPSAPKAFTPLPGQSVEAPNHELREFAKSAGIFRPLNSAMSSRFTSAANPAGTSGDVPAPVPGLYQPAPKGEKEREDMRKPAPEAAREEESLTPAQAAARAGMFGPLTRSSQPWAPEKLLCKRFGVAPPKAGEEEAAAKEPKMSQGAPKATTVNAAWEASRREIERMARDRAWESASSGGAESKFTSSTDAPAEFAQGGLRPGAGSAPSDASASAPPSSAAVQSKAAPVTLANVGLGEDETQGRDTLSYVKPPMDIFRAVFASEDEESDDDDDAPEAPPRQMSKDAGAPVVVQPAPSAAPQPAAPVPPKPAGPDASDPTASFRPTFVAPSKRRAEAEAGAEGEASSTSAVEQGKKKAKKDKKKAKPKGMLTFDLDEE